MEHGHSEAGHTVAAPAARLPGYHPSQELATQQLHDLLGLSAGVRPGAPGGARGAPKADAGRVAAGRFLLPIATQLRGKSAPPLGTLAPWRLGRARARLPCATSRRACRPWETLGGSALPPSYHPSPYEQAEAEFAISSVLSELKTDPWPKAPTERAARCTGVALSLAVALLETSFPNTGAPHPQPQP